MLSEAQDDLRRLIDITTMGWQDAAISDKGLELAATCTVEQVSRLAADCRRTGRPRPCSTSARPHCWRPSRSGRPRPSAATCACVPGGRDDLAGHGARRRTDESGVPTAPSTRWASPISSPARRPTCWSLATSCVGVPACRGPARPHRLSQARAVRVGTLGCGDRRQAGHPADGGTSRSPSPDRPPNRCASDSRRYLDRTSWTPRSPRSLEVLWHDDAHGAPDWRGAVTLGARPARSGGSSHEVDGQRMPAATPPAARPVPAHLACGSTALRGQEGLRRRRLRRVLGAGRRRAGALVRLSRPSAPRTAGDHGRRAGHARATCTPCSSRSSTPPASSAASAPPG